MTAASGNAAVELEGPDAGSVYSASEALVFTTTNWNAAQTVTVRGVDDNVVNSPARSATVSHSIQSGHGDGGKYTPSAPTIAGVTVTLTDDDTHALTLTMASATVAEGNSGTHEVTATVAKPSGSPQVSYSLCFGGTATRDANGTHAPGEDYQVVAPGGTVQGTFGSGSTEGCAGSGGSVQFAVNEDSHAWKLRVHGDTTAESDETVIVTLKESPSSALPSTFELSAAGNPATHTIGDDDTTYRVVLTESGGNTTVAEAGGTDTYTVALSAAPTAAVTVTATAGAGVQVNISGGTAGSTQTLSFTTSNWSTAQTVTVTGVDDDIDNAGDARTVAITHAAQSADSNYTIPSAGSTQVSVTDGDTAAVTVSAASLTVAEAGGTAMYTVELGTQPLGAVTVTVESDDSTAATLDGPDASTAYTGSEELAFTASNWDTAQTVTVQGVDDNVVNAPARTATLTHSIKSAAHGDGGRYLPALSDPEVAVTLTDDEEATPELSLSVTSERGNEGASGQRDVDLTVSLSVARTGATAFKLCAAPEEGSSSTAVLRTADGHEAADYDLVDSGGTALALDGDDCASLSLAAGATSLTVKIRVFGDSSAERPEHVVLELRDAPAGVEIADPGGTTRHQIGNDDGNPVQVVTVTAGAAVAEGSPARFPLTVSGAAAATLHYTVSDDDASDFVASGEEGAQTLALVAGTTSYTIEVPTVNDTTDEADGAVSVTLSRGDGYIFAGGAATRSATVSVTDDDLPGGTPVVSFASGTASAGESTGTHTVTVNLSPAPQAGITLAYTLSGSASRGTDYTISGVNSNSATLSVAAGATSATIAITITDDADDESNETVILTLGTGSGYTVGSLTIHTLTITDNDTAGVTVTPTSRTVAEAGGTATYTVVLDSRPSGSVTITAASDSTAVELEGPDAGSAYSASERLVFTTTNWNAAQTVTVRGVDDTIVNTPARSATVSHSIQSGHGDGGDYTPSAPTIPGVTVTLTDDDTATPAVSFTSGMASAGEGAGTHSVTVNLSSAAPSGGLTLAYTLSGSATRGTDYTISGVSNSATLSVAAGATSATIAITITDDADDENNETVILTLGTGTGYTVGSPTIHTLTITDNDTAGVTVTPTSRTVAEAGGTATYTVVLDSRPSGSVTITAVSGNAAVELEGPDAGSTYSASEALVFTTTNWNAAQTVTVRGVDDSVVNVPARSATVSHSIQSGHGDGAGYRPNLISIDPVTVTLTDDDTATPAVSFASGTESAGEGAGTHSVAVNLTSAAPSGGLTLAYTLSGSASRGTDYTISGVNSNSATVSVAAGATSATIAITITDDADDESNETVILTLGTGTGYTVGSQTIHTLTITDNDTAGVTVTPTSRTVAEAGGTATYTVVLDSRPSGSVTITAASGNAAVELEGPDAGSAYSASEALVFTTTNWSAAQTVTVRGVDDSVVNTPARSATVSHSIQSGHGDGVGYRPNRISIDPVTVTLTDDDVPATPEVSFASATASAGEGAGTHSVAVNLTSAAPPGGLTLAYALSGSAARGTDYTISGVNSNAGALAVAAGATSATIAIAITDDGDAENNETVILTLGTGPGTGYTVGSRNTHTLTITDNDEAPPPAVSFAAPASQAPEAAQVRSIAVRLDRAPAEPLVLAYTVSGTAASGSDYTIAGSGSLSVAAGARSATVSVTVLDDDEAEDDETVVLALAVGAGYTVGSPGTHTLTIQGNDRAGAQAAMRGWLARFGRTVADQVIEAVQGRLRAPASAPESSLRLAGRDWQAAEPEPAGPDSLHAPAGPPAPGTEVPAARADVPAIPQAALPTRREATPERLSDLDWLGGTTFHTAHKHKSGLTSLWGRGAVAQFDGRESGDRLDGRVESVLLGADYAQDGRALGFLLSHSRGEGGWRGQDADGRFKAELTGLHQYARYQANARWSLWSVAGYGQGHLKRTEGAQMRRSDLDAWLVAGGLRGEMRGAAALWPALSMVADVLWVDTKTDGDADFSSVDADVSRIRAGLEGSWASLPLGAGQLSPRLRISLRHDGGDAEHGFGTEVRAGADWVDARHGLRAQLQAHTLLTHEEDGAQEKGFSGSLSWDPRPDSLRGAEFSLAASTGAQPGREGLLSGAAFGTDPARESASSWEATLGYGVGAFGDRFTAVPEARLAWSADAWDLGLGWRLVAERFDLQVRALRREESPGGADEELRIQLQGRW